MGMMDTIKKAGLQAVGASNPASILFGEIINITNLQIKIDQKLTLPKEAIIVPECLTRYEIDLTHSHGGSGNALEKVVIREGLKEGDRVILIRVQGGQQFVILDKVV